MSILRCISPFAFSDTDGVQRVIRDGDLVDEKDPLVKGRELLFETVEVTVDRKARSEQVSGEPAVRRTAKAKSKD
jgi:hypothetical protein